MFEYQHPDVKTNFYIEIAQDLFDRGYLDKSAISYSNKNTIEEVAKTLKDIHEKGIEYGKVIGKNLYSEFHHVPKQPDEYEMPGLPIEAYTEHEEKLRLAKKLND